ncbi:hypothetical protein KQI65_00490 [bacterium]|nr:hypothetical protein [bacterium]
MRHFVMLQILLLVLLGTGCSDGDVSGSESPSIESIETVDVQRARVLLREVIENAMREEVFPGGSPSYGCYTDAHRARFLSSGAFEQLIADAEGSASFVTAVASLRGIDEDEWSEDLAKPIWPTWAMNHRIDNSGTTDAGYAVQQRIGETLLEQAIELTESSETDWSKWLQQHGYQLSGEGSGAHVDNGSDTDGGGSATPTGYPTIVEFSSWMWEVKDHGEDLVGPGPCLFKEKNVRIENGRLILSLVKSDEGQWSCAEVIGMPKDRTFGYGRYTWEIEEIRSPFTRAGGVDLEPTVICGMFTWSDSLQYDQELDVEIGYFGEMDGLPYQFVKQWWEIDGNRHRFDGPIGPGTHQIAWFPDRVEFSSIFPGEKPHRWTYNGPEVPTVGGDLRPRMNIWLLDNIPPEHGDRVEIVFKSFSYEPLK